VPVLASALAPAGGAATLPIFAPITAHAMPAPAASTAATACSATTCSANAIPAQESRWWDGLATSVRTLDSKAVGRDLLAQSWNLGRWLLLAFVLEALITLYVPQAAIAGVLGQNNPLAVPLAALIGVPLYLNNVSALPIVSGLLGQGMQPGAAIAFLIAGPVTTIPAMTAVWGVVRRRVFALYLGVGLGGSILAGLVTNLVF
jgi:uncharacterized protein